MRAMRTVRAWMSLRRPAKSPRMWAESARVSDRRLWMSARRARKLRHVSHHCATSSAARIAPTAGVAMSSADRGSSRVLGLSSLPVGLDGSTGTSTYLARERC